MALTITVSTQAELLSALKSATGGETILLKDGNYGNLSLIDRSTFDLTFASTVTIKAADPANPPVVTGLDMRNASNVSFEGITFDYTANEGAPLWILPFRVSGGNDISFNGCTFDGDIASGLTAVDNGYPTGHGLAIGGVDTVTVTNCEFFNFWKGMSVGGSNDVVVSGNDIHDIRMDGMTFSAVQGVLVEDNHIHNFKTSPLSGDHSDMIQFWTTGTTRPSTDIIIRDNVLDIGDGGYTQSIFMRNELVDAGKAGTEMYYQNVRIENNTIINGHLHGITVGETNGLVITKNAVLHSDGNVPDGQDPTVEIPRINVSSSSTNVTIVQNATSAITGYSDQAGWTVRQNAFVQDQDPNAPGWYGDVFVTSSLTSQNGQHDFIALPDSMLVKLGAGSTEILSRPSTVLDAAFNIADKDNDLHSLTFDASATAGPQPAGTTYVWTFGDGSTTTGKTVTHSYVDGGRYDVKLTVKLPDGSSDTVMAKIVVEDPLVVRMGDKGGFFTSSAGDETFIATPMPLDSAGNLKLGGTGAQASIAHTALERIFGEDDMTIDFRVKTASAGLNGEIFRLHGSLQATVTTAGEVQVRVWSSEGGAVCVTSTGVKINDGAYHAVKVDLDNGKLALFVDGVKVQDADFAGAVVDPGNYDLTFGSGWAKNLVGTLDTFAIHVVDETPVRSAPASSGGLSKPSSSQEILLQEPVVTAPVEKTVLELKADGDFAAYDGATVTVVDIDDSALSGGDLQLSGARRSVATIDDALFNKVFDSEDMTISFRVAADKAGETGEIFRIHGSIITAVNSSGEVQIKVYNDDGSVTRLSSTGAKINDGQFHDVDIRLEDGRLSLWVDDKKLSDAAFAGSIADAGNYDLSFGTSWTSDNFAGDLDSFQISMVDPMASAALAGDAPIL